MKLYLSNKMRGLPHYNWDWFIANAKTLRAKGHEVVNPTEIDEEAGFVFVEYDSDGSISDVRLTSLYNYDEVIGRDLAAVAECEGIVMGPDWKVSEGARLERETAKVFGLRVFYAVEDVPTLCPDVAGKDVAGTLYPILDQVDLLRHQQRTSTEQTAYNEIRVVDPETGGAKGQKLARFDLLPSDALWAVAEQYGRGSLKYDDRNWEKSYAWSLSFAAMMRHAWQFWGGEDIDADSGSSHMAAVAWHALALLTFYLREIGTDDRCAGA